MPERWILLFMFLLSIVLRISLYNVNSSDYTHYISPWYDFIHTHGSFTALKYNFSNYNPAYLYLLALATITPIPKLIAIKTLSILFDGMLAIFTYLIIGLKYKHANAPAIGALVVLFAPTIFINSAAWGQCDAIYTAFCLASLYFLLTNRPAWASLLFGIAFSFKLQAIFFLPVLIILILTRKFPIKYLLFMPVTFLLLLAPAFFAGRDAKSLLSIYVKQVTNSLGHGSGYQRFNHVLTYHAPSIYQWLPTTAVENWKWVGILLATMLVALISFLIVINSEQITQDLILKFTLVFALGLPFLLPEMHDRYFYLADVLAIIYAFYFPNYFYIPLIEQLCSLMSYDIFLFNKEVVNLIYVAFVVLCITTITVADLVKTLYPNMHRQSAMPAIPNKTLLREISDTKDIDTSYRVLPKAR